MKGNKKPVPGWGRVVLAQVVKLVNTGGCQPPGICSQTYKPYGFESRPGQPKAPSIIIVNGLGFVNVFGCSGVGLLTRRPDRWGQSKILVIVVDGVVRGDFTLTPGWRRGVGTDLRSVPGGLSPDVGRAQIKQGLSLVGFPVSRPCSRLLP